jgi:hypothetical protein
MGTVPPARWPLPDKNESEKPAAKAKPQENAMTRIKLALLDEYSVEERRRGYNPYDRTQPARVDDVWRRKPKRD